MIVLEEWTSETFHGNVQQLRYDPETDSIQWWYKEVSAPETMWSRFYEGESGVNYYGTNQWWSDKEPKLFNEEEKP
jgi:hypothetical protein